MKKIFHICEHKMKNDEKKDRGTDSANDLKKNMI
jgi:hypothetical protein